MSRNEKVFVDLFAGCGGLSLGLENAGFKPIFVNELSPDAMETYLVNRDREFGVELSHGAGLHVEHPQTIRLGAERSAPLVVRRPPVSATRSRQ